MTIIVSGLYTTPPSVLYPAILNDIYTLTARPDLVMETAKAIRKATMKFHLADFWKNDILSQPVYPVAVSTGSVDWRYSIDTTSLPLLRKIASISEYTVPLTGTEQYYKEKDADRVLDEYRAEYINYWWQAGQQVNLRANKLLTQVLIVGYMYPNVTIAGYNSWIAQQFQDAIIEEACASLYRHIGKLDEANALAGNFAENLHMITMAQVG
jgi:hypothetical protein